MDKGNKCKGGGGGSCSHDGMNELLVYEYLNPSNTFERPLFWHYSSGLHEDPVWTGSRGHLPFCVEWAGVCVGREV